MTEPLPSHSDPACADPNCSYRAEAEMAIETRENANAVTLRVEAERDRYRAALERVGVACDNGSQPKDKLTFIRRVTRSALDA